MAELKRRQMLGEMLFQKGLVSEENLSRALQEQRRTGEFLGTTLTRMGILRAEQLMPILAEHVGLASVRLADVHIAPEVLAKVPPKFASRYFFIPISFTNNILQVAIADPFDIQTLDELKLLLGCDISPVLAAQEDIQAAIQRHYGIGASAVERILDTGPRQNERVSVAEDLNADADAASVITFVNQLILSAVKERATDIHIEPFDESLRIRQRVDGVMYEVPIPTDLVKLHQAIVSRIKVMAKLDIAERRMPQDGRIKVKIEDQELDLRVSVLPTSYGETVNIRLLSSSMLYDLEELGMAKDQLDGLLKLIEKPHGIIFVTGPTGSGKTTTLYACLTRLNHPDVKILTIEDPIEYQLFGITQLQIHPKIGFSFAHGLRSMLRHDPDIMMVGEVRDPETAEITIRSALTGHLVFSTLHTNDAAGGVTRLLDMGIEPFLVASSVLCFIAQRLVRVVCPNCKESRPPGPGLMEEFGVAASEIPKTLFYGKGCTVCKGTGYKGRTAIYEFLPVTDTIKQLILQQSSSQDIARAAQQAGPVGKGGMRTLRQDGWRKIVSGLTTPEEVLKVS